MLQEQSISTILVIPSVLKANPTDMVLYTWDCHCLTRDLLFRGLSRCVWVQ